MKNLLLETDYLTVEKFTVCKQSNNDIRLLHISDYCNFL